MLANFVEEVKPKTWGSFCIGLIVITAIGAFFAFSIQDRYANDAATK